MLNQVSRVVRRCAYQVPFIFFMIAGMHEANGMSAKVFLPARESSRRGRYNEHWRAEGAAPKAVDNGTLRRWQAPVTMTAFRSHDTTHS